MSWRSEYMPKIGDMVCIIPSDNGPRQPYDHLELKPGIITMFETAGCHGEYRKYSVLIEGEIVKVWYEDLFHLR